MKNLTQITCLLLTLFCLSCKKDNSSFNEDIIGTYTGQESHTYHPAFPPPTPDTVYNQTYKIFGENSDEMYLFTSLFPRLNDTRNEAYTYTVNNSDFSKLEYYFHVGDASTYHNYSIQIREDSLFIDYKNYHFTNVDEWHFSGVKTE